MTGIFPDTDATGGLPKESFVVAIPLVNGAWLKWRLPLVDIGPEGEPIPFDLTISLACTPTRDVHPVRHNALTYLPSAFVATAHVNAQRVDASASVTVSFCDTIHQLTSSYAAIFAQQINT